MMQIYVIAIKKLVCERWYKIENRFHLKFFQADFHLLLVEKNLLNGERRKKSAFTDDFFFDKCHTKNCSKYMNILIKVILIAFFTKLSWPGDSEGTFQFSSQTAACSLVYPTK